MKTPTGIHDPDPGLASWLVREVRPGARIARWERLPGAFTSLVDGVRLEGPGGRALEVVVRRYDGKRRTHGPDLVRAEATVLAVVGRRLAWPAVPEVLAVDPGGQAAGWPTIVSTRLPGAPALAAAPGLPVARLVGGLAEVHRAVAAAGVPTAGLPPFDPWVDPVLAVPAHTAVPHAWEQALAALEALPGRVPPTAVPWRFVHRDLHPANVLWAGGRPSGIVDWVNGCEGPVEADVARCRVNLAASAGAGAPDAFLAALGDLLPSYDRRWDLLVCAELLPDASVLTTLTELGVPVSARRARAAVDSIVVAAVEHLGGR